LTLLVGSFDPQKKPVPDMTYNVFIGMLNPTQSIIHSYKLEDFVGAKIYCPYALADGN